MASEGKSGPPADDTVVLGPGAREDADDAALADEDTLADEAPVVEDEWPVAEHYRIEPDESPPPEPEPAETVVATRDEPGPVHRRFPPEVGPWLLLAIAAAVGALILGAVLVQELRGEDDGPAPASSSTTQADTTDRTATAPPGDADAIALRDLEGLSLAEARKAVEGAGLELRVTREPSDRPRGEVLEQAPPPGTKLSKGELVTLVVSPGPQEEKTVSATVPDVVGLTASKAVAALRDAGLEARIRLVTSTRRDGLVVAQSPAAGVEAARGGKVRLDVAKRRPAEPARIEVPDLVGTSVADARERLRSLGLTSTVVKTASDEPEGTVVGQTPGAGAELRKGGSVTLRVSSGPEKVIVPDVTGLDEASARAELERAGFQVQVQDEPTADPAQDGKVVSQSPSGGTSAAEGTVVTITVGRLG